MLERLLQLLATDNTVDLGALAAELGVTRPEVESMLETLVRLGYLERVAATCDLTCTGCPLGETCRRQGGYHLWRVTASGARFQR